MSTVTPVQPLHGRPPGSTSVRPFPLAPRLWPSTPRESLATGISRARWLLLGYWSLLVSGYVVLGATISAYGHVSTTDFTVILGLLLTSLLGVASGNLLGLARLRPWVILGLLGASIALACAAASTVGPWVTVFAMTFVWSLGCGHLTLQRRFSLATLWIPVVCWVGATLAILEHQGRLHTWQSGHKAAVWQPVTLGLLFALVTEVFLFFAGQEHYHALVWQTHSSNAPPTVLRHPGGNPTGRLTGRGVAAILVAAVMVCGATALVAPYLWRTEPTEHHGDRHDARPEAQDDRDYRPDVDWEGFRRALDRAVKAARRQGGDLLPFVPLFVLNRPVRRWWRLRRLRRPVGTASPSRRAADLWHYVRIALGDAGLAPRPGESIEDTVARVTAVRAAMGHGPPPGLSEAAEVYQRVRYGLGIPEGAVETLRTYALTAWDGVRRPLSIGQRLGALWRRMEP